MVHGWFNKRSQEECSGRVSVPDRLSKASQETASPGRSHPSPSVMRLELGRVPAADEVETNLGSQFKLDLNAVRALKSRKPDTSPRCDPDMRTRSPAAEGGGYRPRFAHEGSESLSARLNPDLRRREAPLLAHEESESFSARLNPDIIGRGSFESPSLIREESDGLNPDVSSSRPAQDVERSPAAAAPGPPRPTPTRSGNNRALIAERVARARSGKRTGEAEAAPVKAVVPDAVQQLSLGLESLDLFIKEGQQRKLHQLEDYRNERKERIAIAAGTAGDEQPTSIARMGRQRRQLETDPATRKQNIAARLDRARHHAESRTPNADADDGNAGASGLLLAAQFARSWASNRSAGRAVVDSSAAAAAPGESGGGSAMAPASSSHSTPSAADDGGGAGASRLQVPRLSAPVCEETSPREVQAPPPIVETLPTSPVEKRRATFAWPDVEREETFDDEEDELRVDADVEEEGEEVDDDAAEDEESIEMGEELLRLKLSIDQERKLSLLAQEALVKARVARARACVRLRNTEEEQAADASVADTSKPQPLEPVQQIRMTLEPLDLYLRDGQQQRLHQLEEYRSKRKEKLERLEAQRAEATSGERELQTAQLLRVQEFRARRAQRLAQIAETAAAAVPEEESPAREQLRQLESLREQRRERANTVSARAPSSELQSQDSLSSIYSSDESFGDNAILPVVSQQSSSSNGRVRRSGSSSARVLSSGGSSARVLERRPTNLGKELANLALTPTQQQSLSEIGRHALYSERLARARNARQQARRRRRSVKEREAQQLLDFGHELVSLEMTDEEEASLSASTRDALAAARMLRAGAADAAAAVLPSRQQSAQRYRSQAWLDLGRQLSELGLREEEEATFSSYGRDAMVAWRALSKRSLPDLPVQAVPAAREGQSWLDFGRELSSLNLGEREEASLSSQARDALAACRILQARQKSGNHGPEAELKRMPSKRLPWVEFGNELTALGLSETEEAALSSQARDALTAAYLISARAISRKSRASFTLGTNPEGWLELGQQLERLDLREDEEADLSTQAHDALVAARLLRVREAAGASSRSQQAMTPWVDIGMQLAALDLGEADEAMLSTQGRDALSAVRALQGRSAETGRATGATAWLDFGRELTTLHLGEDVEATLSAASRDALVAARALDRRIASSEDRELAASQTCRAARKNFTPWLDLGRELTSLHLCEEDEAALSNQTRDALAAARALQARLELREDAESRATDALKEGAPVAHTPWLALGRELASLHLTEEEEALLSAAALDALVAVRSAGIGMPRPTRTARLPWIDFGLELASLQVDEEDEATLSAQGRAALSAARAIQSRSPSQEARPDTPWLDFGLELASLGLTENAEAGLSAQAKDALAVARGLRSRVDAGEKASALARAFKRQGPPKSGTPWVDFGSELQSLHLNESAEAALSTQARDSLTAARFLQGRVGLRETDEAATATAARGASAQPAKSWLAFGRELALLKLEESDEAALSGQGRAALSAARALNGRLALDEDDESAPSTMKKSRWPTKAGSTWLDFGRELASLPLSEEEEAALSALARDALAAARGLQGRLQLSEDVEASTAPPRRDAGERGTPWLDMGRELASLQLSEEEEATLSRKLRDAMAVTRVLHGRLPAENDEWVAAHASKGSPWLDLGREMASLQLSEDMETTLSDQARDALVAARLLQGRLKLGEGDESVAPQSRKWQSTAGTPWLDIGHELASLNLGEEEEAALSAQARDALAAARLLQGQLGAVEDSESAPSRRRTGTPWLEFGRELASLELGELEEAALSAHARDARAAARMLHSRLALQEVSEASPAQAGRGARRGFTTPWLDFGLELASLQLDEVGEERLSAQTRDALAAARAVQGQLALGEDEESTATRPHRRRSNECKPWLDLGRELASLQLGEDEEAVLSTQTRDAVTVARALEGRLGVEEDTEAPTGSQRRGRSKAATGLLALGVELASLQLSEEDEAALGARGRAALCAARSLPGRLALVEEDEASATHGRKRGTPLLDLGSELASLELSEEDEAALGLQARDAVAAARALHGRLALSEGAESMASQARPKPSKARSLRLDYAKQLASLQLDEVDEAVLSAQSRDAIAASRALLGQLDLREERESTSAQPRKGHRNVNVDCSLLSLQLGEDDEAALSAKARDALRAARLAGEQLSATERDEAATARGRRGTPWLDLGGELAALNLEEQNEAALDDQTRAALAAARALQGRLPLNEADEAAPSGARQGRGAGRSQWLDLGHELASLDLDEHGEAALSAQARAAKHAVRQMHGVLSVGEHDEAAASQASGRRRGTPWLDLGAELASLRLGENDEAALSTETRDALAATRLLQGRLPLEEKEESRATRPQKGTGARGKPWLGLGAELASLQLKEDEEAALNAQGRAALGAARALQGRLAVEEQDESPTGSGRRGTPWLDFGRELASLQLGEDEEEALCAPAREARAAALALGDPPDLAEGSEAQPAAVRGRRNAPWLDFGFEVASLGLGEQDEAQLSSQARAALDAARLLSGRLSVGEEDEATVARARRGARGKAKPWVEFGMQLDSLHLSEAEEKSLSDRGRDALVVARAAKPPSPSKSPTPTPWVDFGLELAALDLHEDEEALLGGQSRDALAAARVVKRRPNAVTNANSEGCSWLDFGCELDALDLSEAEQAALTAMGREALAAGEVLRPRKANDKHYPFNGRNSFEKPWLNFGRELASLDLSDEEEAQLAAPGRDALVAARVAASRTAEPLRDVTSAASIGSKPPHPIRGQVPVSGTVAAGEGASGVDSAAAPGVGSIPDSFWMRPYEPLQRAASGPLAKYRGDNSNWSQGPLEPSMKEPPATARASLTTPSTTLPAALNLTEAAASPAESPAASFTQRDAPAPPASVFDRVLSWGAGLLKPKHGSSKRLDSTSSARSSGATGRGARRESIDSQGQTVLKAIPVNATETKASAGQSRASSHKHVRAGNLQPEPPRCSAQLNGSSEAAAHEEKQHFAASANLLPHAARDLGTGAALAMAPDPVASKDPASVLVDTTTLRACPPNALTVELLSAPTCASSLTVCASHVSSDTSSKAGVAAAGIGGVGQKADSAGRPVSILEANQAQAPNLDEIPTGNPLLAVDVTSSLSPGKSVDLLSLDQRKVSTATLRPEASGVTLPRGHSRRGSSTVLDFARRLRKGSVSGASFGKDGIGPELSQSAPRQHEGFEEAERTAFAKHLNFVLAEDPFVRAILPLDPASDELFDAISGGILLPRFVLHVDRQALDPRALNQPRGGEVLEREQSLQNHTLCANAATSIGCGVAQLLPSDLQEAGTHQQLVLELVWRLTRHELLSSISTELRPELLGLQLQNEESHSFSSRRPEQLLLRWVNYHIQRFIEQNAGQRLVPATWRVTNLHEDLASGVALAILLKQVLPPDPKRVDLIAAARKPKAELAELVVQTARQAGVKLFEVQAEDIIEPRPRMLLGFVASVFHAFPSVSVQTHPPSASKLLKRHNNEGREERALRMWMTSLGLGLVLTNLFEDCRNGIPLLKVCDYLKPGIVDWSTVRHAPSSIYERVQNCNAAIDSAQLLGLHVIGIGGKDIADGNSTLILAVVWQLMRAHVCNFLQDLGMGERDVLAWANCTIAHSDARLHIKNFSDSSLRTGVFILQLARAVAPECVEPSEILPGESSEQCELNARYAISCILKMGCTVFAVWEDIIDVRAKMLMTIFAAVMSEDLRRNLQSGLERGGGGD